MNVGAEPRQKGVQIAENLAQKLGDLLLGLVVALQQSSLLTPSLSLAGEMRFLVLEACWWADWSLGR